MSNPGRAVEALTWQIQMNIDCRDSYVAGPGCLLARIVQPIIARRIDAILTLTA